MRETSTPAMRRNRQAELAALLSAFRQELTQVTVLDPACGSGNFLYIALNALLDLEKEVISHGAANGLSLMFPEVRPTQLYGLEINRYAQELTQVVVWIGYLQWMTANGFAPRRDPVLGGMDNIRLQDALLDRSDPEQAKEAEWPKADYIIGNPPFLGGKRIRSELGDEYIRDLFAVYDDRLPHFSDLCCYFFERARGQIELGLSKRAGLLATNSIRGGANRVVLDRITASGDIFMAWDDEEWVLDGAAVRISIVGLDGGEEASRHLNGVAVGEITSALTSGIDLSRAKRLTENAGIGFIGDQPTGPFDAASQQAQAWLALPTNPNGRTNADVLRRYWSGSDVTGRWAERWIVDFGVDMAVNDAALYEAPYEYVWTTVKPTRATNRNAQLRDRWWLHRRPRPDMRVALQRSCNGRFLCTPHVSKHRVFKWLDTAILPNNLLIVFARDDDYFFGVLHSRAHEVWSLRMGTWLGKGNDPRYTPTTTFETFPFPYPSEEQREAIGAAAKHLNELREAWLNPPDADEVTLKKRTLTNLYNQRPSWLANAHATLDQDVWAAYGWPEDPAQADDETIL